MVSIRQIAAICHAANRAYQLEHGDPHPSRPWDETHPSTHDIVIAGVRGFLQGDTPRSSHERWVSNKKAQGYTWGPVKDHHARTHPCLVPYDDLLEHEQAKDRMMYGIVCALAPLLPPAEQPARALLPPDRPYGEPGPYNLHPGPRSTRGPAMVNEYGMVDPYRPQHPTSDKATP